MSLAECDLLSLRAAVRRVLEARSEMQRQRDIGVLIDAVDELAAEMGGIDKGEGGKA